MNINFLLACEGDSFLIRNTVKGKTTNILIDGGVPATYFMQLKDLLEKEVCLNEQIIDLLVVTHRDNDHIGGIIKLFEDNTVDKKKLINDVWFNSHKTIASNFDKIVITEDEQLIKNTSTKTSLLQQNTLEKALTSLLKWKNHLVCYIKDNEKIQIGSIEITILSPRFQEIEVINMDEGDNCKTAKGASDYTESIEILSKKRFIEDDRSVNRSSISLLLESDNKRLLFLGDSHPSDIVNSLVELGYSETNPLHIDVVKVSHHGSKGNTNDELLKIIKCNKYIISTNGSRYGHPDKEALARIIASQGLDMHFYFNYNLYKKIFTQNEINEYKLHLHQEYEIEV